MFSIPRVQTFIAKKATNYLKDTYDVELEIGRIGIGYLGSVDLKEVLALDHHGDTLLYAGSIQTSILNLREISKGQPELGEVAIKDLFFNMKIYKGEDSDNLMTYIRKFNTGKKKTSNAKFILTSGRVTIQNGRYYYTDEDLRSPEVIRYDDIILDSEGIRIDDGDFYITTNVLSFKDRRGLVVSNLQTSFSIKPDQMHFENLILETPDSKVKAEIDFSYQPEDLIDFENKVQIKADFKEGTVSTNDLIPFYGEFGKNQMLNIKKTRLTGTLNDFRLHKAFIKGLDRSVIKGDIHIENALSDDVSKFKLEGEFTELTTNYYDLINLLPELLGTSLPKELYKFGNVRAEGNAIVTRNVVDVDMDLFSHLGKVNAFVLLGKLNDVKNATYNGNIISSNFNIGKLIGRETVGKAAFNIHVDGSGFEMATVNTKVEGDINSLVINGYGYSNIKILGSLRDPVFDGKLTSNDPNANFRFNGIIDFSETINTYDFVANVDHLDLHKLGFIKKDSTSILKGDVIMDVKGTGIDDAFGTISFAQTSYENKNGAYYFEDFDITSKFDEEGVRTISMNSPDIIEGNVKGVFRIENVYDLFRNSIGSLYTNFEANEITDNEFMEFNFNIYNKIIDVFIPEIEFAPNTFIKGKVESDDAEFKLTFKSPSIQLYDNTMHMVDIQVDNKNPIFNTFVSIDSVDSKHYKASEFNLVNVTLNDTLFIRSEFKGGKGNEDSFNLELYHTINEDNKSVVGFRKSDLTFKGYTWYVNERKSKRGNNVIFDNKFTKVDINSIVLTHKDEQIRVNGVIDGKDDKNVEASFIKVDLNKIIPDIENLLLNGEVNGNVTIFQEGGKYFPSSTIKIDSLEVNKHSLGELRMNIAGNESLTQYRINSRLLDKSHKKTFSALGMVDVQESGSDMKINVDLNEFDISCFSQLGGIVFEDLRGLVSGKATINGSYKDPAIDGMVTLKKAGLKIPYLNVDFDFEENARMLLQKQRFVFDEINIMDTKYKTRGILGGYIEHKQFSDWYLGLNILADRMVALDTEEEEESLYFGTAFISGDASIKGPINGLVIDVNARSEKGTIFKIPLKDSESLGDNSYIHFLSHEEKKARLEGKDIIVEDLNGLAINFDLDVNDNAEVEIVIDKKNGSSLKGRGAGNLLIELNTNGKFNMWGDFHVYEGTYNFRYGALIEKVFTVSKESDNNSINWDGSPTRAILDLNAIYKTEANPVALLENSTINRKVPVEVVVYLKGELIQPELNFDIRFPNLSSVIKSELEYKLEDKSTRDFQALSLLTQGQFYNELNLGQNLITGNLVERASSLVNDIFAGEDDKFKVGLNYVQGNRGIDSETSDKFGVTLSTKISDRILINGRVGVLVGGVDESVVVGNVEAEYLFNEEGTLRGKIFNRENEVQYVGTPQGHKQGIGLSYSVDFDNFNELWRKIFKNKKQRDSIPKIKDSTKIKAPDFINFTKKDEK
ncbi:translocation/assembly module TamB domain-containing protein [Aquimarina hainanensis]|uniref:Translocation/assembly module TamB domain-containing protein n=1 Tax=Aquimarina hainanensis TaxID=1578017 RepID=A0ABW5NCC3_9FLAO